MNSLSAYQNDLSRLPRPLSARGEATASPSDLALHNATFAARVAYEYRGRGIPLPELICQANLGLVEAARLYDPSRGVKFISYAVWRIRRRILEAFAQSALCGYSHLDGQTVSLDAPVDLSACDAQAGGQAELALADVLPDAAPSPDAAAAEGETQALVESALDVLPKAERAAVRLCYGLEKPS